MGRTIKFGLQQPRFQFPSDDGLFQVVKRTAQEAEALGFDSFWLMDHFFQIPGVGRPEEPLMEGWTTLAALAASTSRIRLATLCTSNAYRNPALLAKMGATLDVISGGRLIMGIGGGWYQQEFDAYGIPFLPVGQRLRRLEEGVQIIHKMWTEEAPDFQGRYYAIKGARCNPPPIQKPRPPILIGGGGEKLTLRLVAKYADMCNIFGDVATSRRKLQVLGEHCAQVGRDPSAIVKSRLGTIVIARNETELLDKLTRLCPPGMTPDVYRQRVMAGTPSQCIQACHELVDAGLEYLIFNMPDSYDADALRLFAHEVMPAFQ